MASYPLSGFERYHQKGFHSFGHGVGRSPLLELGRY